MKEYWYMGMCIIYPLTFLFSFMYTRKIPSKYYMYGFFWYPTVSLVVVVAYILLVKGLVTEIFYSRVNMISIVFHYFFLARFISNSINHLKYLNAFRFLFYFFLIVTICAVVFTYFYMSYKGLSLSVANIGLVVLSLFYYNSLFDEDFKSDLYKEPSFWVITGIVLGMSLNIPFHALSFQILAPFQNILYEWIVISAITGYYIMHIFFIKASLLCSTQTLKK